MKFKRRLALETGQLDMTPLINVILQLLIFFILTSSFVFQPGIKVNLPRAVTSEAIQEKSLVLMIAADNRIYLNDRLITRAELASRLKVASKENKPLLIKADRQTLLDRVVEVLDLCRREGMSQINIATNQEIKS
ncbi:MAG: biopolymer transporter ExbD [Candidatus Omnitrophica bacterium]|nr:biopolymer transporter ExbD [Candidatus Omnitrophota bacterium]